MEAQFHKEFLQIIQAKEQGNYLTFRNKAHIIEDVKGNLERIGAEQRKD